MQTAEEQVAHYQAVRARITHKHLTTGRPLRRCHRGQVEKRNMHGFFGLQVYAKPIGPVRVLWSWADIVVPAPTKEPTTIKARRILAEVAEVHGVTAEAICGECKTQMFVRARQHAFYRLAMETGLSSVRIGRFVGNKDHTTVLHGVKKHAARMAQGIAQ